MKEKILETQRQLNPQAMTAEDIQDWLASQIAEQIGVDADEIDTKVPFDSYGLDSVQTMSIANLGKQYFGVQLSPIIIWNYPNIESLSQYLVQELETSEVEMFEV
ncbi:MAG: acyl carrier protein [Hydrococcus sp. RM1_1_31]|nr:acyl carrier protein [Hydrococcus sp. RM1_1_31]